MTAAPEILDRWMHVPAELRERPQWVVWRWVERGDRMTKQPFRATSPATEASATDPGTWSTFEDAIATAAKAPGVAGIGYVFSPDDPYCGVDFDHALDAGNNIRGWALDWIRELGGYQEVSPSGKGIKLIVQASVSRGRNTKGKGTDGLGGIEVYSSARFFTITGDIVAECLGIPDRQPIIDRLLSVEFPESRPNRPKPGKPVILSLVNGDAELLRRIKRSDIGDRFSSLYDRGDASPYDGDDSAADLALCNLLAFWCGPDVDRIDRLFRRSALMRPKWDEMRGQYTYGQRTIDKALSDRTEFYEGGARYKPSIRGQMDRNGNDRADSVSGDSATTTGRSGRGYRFPLIVRGAEVEAKDVRWLWENRIPFGFLTLMAGRTGVGKSFTTLDVAARITVGGETPDGGGLCFEAGSVLIISEDSHEYMLAPRLREAGANMDRISFMSWEAMAEFTLADAEMLDDVYFDAGEPKLVVIDPPTNFLGNKDEHRNAEVRSVLMGVSIWSMRHDVATVLITHCNKGIKKDIAALDRVIGSIAWASTSRIAHIFSPHPDERDQAVFLPLKNNLGALTDGLAYRVVKTLRFARVEWLGKVEFDADDAMSGEKKKPRGVAAVEWLEDRFRERREWRSDDLKRDANEAGVSKNALWSPEVLALPIRKAKRTDAAGETHWFWIAQESWPPEQENDRESGNLGNLDTQTQSQQHESKIPDHSRSPGTLEEDSQDSHLSRGSSPGLVAGDVGDGPVALRSESERERLRRWLVLCLNVGDASPQDVIRYAKERGFDEAAVRAEVVESELFEEIAGPDGKPLWHYQEQW